MNRSRLGVLSPLLLAFALACASGGGSGVGSSASRANMSGDELRSKGDLSGAYSAYFKEAQKKPDNEKVHVNLGEVAVDLKKYDEAVVALEKAKQLGAGNRATVALAAAKAGQGKYDEASAMMDEVLNDDDDAENFYKAGNIKLAARKPREAQPLLETALKKDKKLEHQGAVGRCQSALGQHEEAIKTLDGVLKQYKKQGAVAAEMEVSLANSMVATGRLEEAFQKYRHAAGMDPRNGEAQARYAAMMRERGDIEGAITVLKAAESKQPHSGIVQYQLGLAYKDFKLREQAVIALQKAIQYDPSLGEAYTPLLAMMEEDKVSTDKLYGTLEAAANGAPGDFELQMRFGKLAEGKKQYAKALAAYDRAVKATPGNVEANFALGSMQVVMGKIEDAKQSYDALRTIDEMKAADLLTLIERVPAQPQPKQAQADAQPKPKNKAKPSKKAKGKKKGR
ncbi:MAG: tetratricopeptide repeat protein [Myxococcota bacterium]